MEPFDWKNLDRVFVGSRPDICPYLPNRKEQKLITLLNDGDVDEFAKLSNRGFRRSHDAAYRPACPTCNACKALRIKACDFRPNKTQRRLKNRYKNLFLTVEDREINTEHWSLFTNYINARHSDGSMALMSRQDFANMVSDSPVQTQLLAWRDGEDGPLVAACLIDVLPDGLSAVYSYFSSGPAWPSLGTFVILALLDLTGKAELDYVHLGYWVAGSPKMSYKARFGPAEIYADECWQVLPKQVE